MYLQEFSAESSDKLAGDGAQFESTTIVVPTEDLSVYLNSNYFCNESTEQEMPLERVTETLEHRGVSVSIVPNSVSEELVPTDMLELSLQNLEPEESVQQNFAVAPPRFISLSRVGNEFTMQVEPANFNLQEDTVDNLVNEAIESLGHGNSSPNIVDALISFNTNQNNIEFDPLNGQFNSNFHFLSGMNGDFTENTVPPNSPDEQN